MVGTFLRHSVYIKQRFSFYRATACNATHGIAVAIPSVCLSVRQMRVL